MGFLQRKAKWEENISQEKPTQVYTFNVANKYSDKDIEITVNVPGVEIPTPSTGTNTFWLKIGGIKYIWKVDSSGNVWVEGDK